MPILRTAIASSENQLIDPILALINPEKSDRILGIQLIDTILALAITDPQKSDRLLAIQFMDPILFLPSADSQESDRLLAIQFMDPILFLPSADSEKSDRLWEIQLIDTILAIASDTFGEQVAPAAPNLYFGCYIIGSRSTAEVDSA